MSCRLRVRLYVEPRARTSRRSRRCSTSRPPTREDAEATVVCTPGLRLPGYRNGRAVTIDLDRTVTRVFGSDFVGEPKRAGLRMWSKRAWERGGLPLHAAVSAAGRVPGAGRMALLVGRPGTGKSTLAFADAADGIACQEDRSRGCGTARLCPQSARSSPRLALLREGYRPIRDAFRELSSHLENVRQHGDALDLSDVPGGPPGRVVFGSCGAPQSDARRAAASRDPAGAQPERRARRRTARSRGGRGGVCRGAGGPDPR